MKRVIRTSRAPEALGPYSQGVVKGDFCFVSMELGIEPKSGKLKDGSITEETKQAIMNVKSILEAADYSLDDVVKVTLYITDLSLFSAINEEYAKFFKREQPARSLVVVQKLPLNARVAVDAIALKV